MWAVLWLAISAAVLFVRRRFLIPQQTWHGQWVLEIVHSALLGVLIFPFVIIALVLFVMVRNEFRHRMKHKEPKQ